LWINIKGTSNKSKVGKLSKFDSILKQNKEIKNFVVSDVDSEWNSFLDMVGESTEVKKVETKPKSKIKSLIYTLSIGIAATLVLLLVFTLALQPETKIRESYTASKNNDIIQLADGSKIFLQNGASIEYPKVLSEANERKIVLNGSAKFDVTKSILPFRVYNSGIIVEVLGTEFSITQENQKVIVENHSGSVQVLEAKDRNNFRILKQGDKFVYENGQFTDMNYKPEPVIVAEPVTEPKIEKPKPKVVEPKPEVKEEVKPAEVVSGSVYTLDSVLKGHLVKLNKKTIKVDKKFKYDKDQRVRVNLNQSFLEIMQSLKTQGFIDMIPGDCPDCYIITAPTK